MRNDCSAARLVTIIRWMDIIALIDEFEAGGQRVKDAIAGLTQEELRVFPVPGTWSIQQIVIHLQNADAVVVDRMKRIIAENNPLLIAFDENLWVKNLFYADQPAATAAELLDLTRRQFVHVLRRLPESAWEERTGIHNKRGKVTLGEMLEIYTKHLAHHL